MEPEPAKNTIVSWDRITLSFFGNFIALFDRAKNVVGRLASETFGEKVDGMPKVQEAAMSLTFQDMRAGKYCFNNSTMNIEFCGVCSSSRSTSVARLLPQSEAGGIGHRIVETPICKISIEKHKPQNVKREFAIYPDLLVPVARSRCPFPWPILWSIPVDIYMAHRPVSRVFEWLPYPHHCLIYSSHILVP